MVSKYKFTKLAYLLSIYHRGQNTTVQSDNVIASAWLDRKIVNVMATGYDPTKVDTVLRRQKDGNRKEISCPVTVAD